MLITWRRWTVASFYWCSTVREPRDVLCALISLTQGRFYYRLSKVLNIRIYTLSRVPMLLVVVDTRVVENAMRLIDCAQNLIAPLTLRQSHQLLRNRNFLLQRLLLRPRCFLQRIVRLKRKLVIRWLRLVRHLKLLLEHVWVLDHSLLSLDDQRCHVILKSLKLHTKNLDFVVSFANNIVSFVH